MPKDGRKTRSWWRVKVTKPLRDFNGGPMPGGFLYSEPVGDGRLEVTLDIVMTDSGPECRSVELEALGGAVPATALRHLEIRRMLREAPQRVADYAAGRELLGQEDATIVDTAIDLDGARRNIRIVMSDRRAKAARNPRGKAIRVDLAEVANTYRKARQLGQPPTLAVAHEHHVSRTTASRWIARCRDQGLLGRAIPGSAGEYS